ncbi:MAG: hypothetical protein ACREMI_06515, partial [Gemmatimonadales bacterium]
YYAEDERLTEYFQLMRALQAEPNRRAAEVQQLRAYERLYEVTSSPLFGRPRDEDKLLPTGHDALAEVRRTRHRPAPQVPVGSGLAVFHLPAAPGFAERDRV